MLTPLDWIQAPEKLVLHQGDVHTWFAGLDQAEDSLSIQAASLSSKETAKVERLLRPLHQRRARHSYIFLRDVLSRYLNVAPSELTFAHNDHGKPFLAEPFTDLGLQFNLTHSGEVALLAITLHADIGIDVEHLQKELEYEQLAERFFSGAECQELMGLQAESRKRAFFHGWTRKEAYIKAIGLGLSYSLDQFDVSLTSTDEHGLLSIEGNEIYAREWLLFNLELPVDDYMAAIAIQAKSMQLSSFVW